MSGHHRFKRQKGPDSHALGWCETHQKRLFTSRKKARKARQNGAELNAYRCDAVPRMWHLGHLPPQVKYGMR